LQRADQVSLVANICDRLFNEFSRLFRISAPCFHGIFCVKTRNSQAVSFYLIFFNVAPVRLMVYSKIKHTN